MALRQMPPLARRSHASAAATPGSTSTVMRNRGHVFNSADSEARSREHPDCCLGPRAWCSRLVASRCPDSDVKRCNSPVLRYSGRCSGCLHRCIRRPLKSICLHMLSTCASRYGLSAAEVRDVNKRIVERRIDVCDTPPLRDFLLGHQVNPLEDSKHLNADSSYLTFLELRLDELWQTSLH